MTVAPLCRVGADIGGTFTDLVLLTNEGRIVRKKAPSTTDDYARGILEALEDALDDSGGTPSAVEEVVHGTTVATNAILEYKGARCGLITTCGFRDVLEFRRLRMPQLYRLDWKRPPVLIDRELRLEINERISSDGSVLQPVDRDEVLAVVRGLLSKGVTSIAVALINSYANPAHEIEVGAIIGEAFPELPVSLSSVILPEIQEYERTSTSVVNAYVQPTVRRYLQNLRANLSAADIAAPLLIMQSNGGLMSSRRAGETPVRIIESGPAAGVIACREIARTCGYANLMCFDMGGTTAKASLIEEGNLQESGEYEVGGGVSIGSRLNRGGGYVIRLPSIDIAEVGAGGGSLVSFDRAGGLKVGPESAGSMPGPVCYRNGNEQPTVTDANVTLGYISPEGLAGGTLAIDVAAARQAMEARVAERISASIGEAAMGVHMIANASMIRALRSVTIERGRDPSEFALCAFGGSGPVHAAHIAQAMGISTTIIPPCPGVFSAFGLLLADVEHHFTRTVRQPLDDLRPDDLAAQFDAMAVQAHEGASDPAYPLSDYRLHRMIVLRFAGQSTGLSVEMPDGTVCGASVDALKHRFYEEYRRTYGFDSPGEKIDVEAIRLVARSAQRTSDTWLKAAADAEMALRPTPGKRCAYFGEPWGWTEATVLTRASLTRAGTAGPIVIEGYDATTVVPPDCSARLDDHNNIIVTIGNRGENLQ